MQLLDIPQVIILPSNDATDKSSNEDQSVSVTSKKRKFARISSDNKNKKHQSTEIITIGEVGTHPNMNTWAPIRRNILTEDDNYHSNIPYFGDEAIGSNFIKSFEETVKNDVKIFEDDSLFLSLVNNLSKIDISNTDTTAGTGDNFKVQVLASPSSEEQKKWHLTSTIDRSLPG